jgi:pimeloyl-ACP methyl ester carboxylesterase
MERGEVPYLLNGAFRRMAYVSFGSPERPPVLCVHGLTRTGRDFDVLARALANEYFVISPDLPGRGASDWLPSGGLYQPASYVIALGHLLAAIGRPVIYVGTSLGGICGMALAASEHAPIEKMILNDIGPFIPAAALRRIRDYMAMGEPPPFASLGDVETYLRQVHAPFGPMTDADWQHLARTSIRTAPDGKFLLHYDPKIAEPIRGNEPSDTDLWSLWSAIRAPVLAIRGAESDLFLAETLERMEQSGATGYVVPGVGHAPSLTDAASVDRIRAFLRA